MKKILITTLALMLCLVLVACGSIIQPLDFVQNGLQITLDTSFTQIGNSGYTACYRSPIATVYLLREAFDDELTEDVSLADYAGKVLEANSLQRKVESVSSYLTFTYETESDDLHLIRYVCLYKTSDSFWMVQFVCLSDYYDDLGESFEEWAASVKDVKVNADTTEQG